MKNLNWYYIVILFVGLALGRVLWQLADDHEKQSVAAAEERSFSTEEDGLTAKQAFEMRLKQARKSEDERKICDVIRYYGRAVKIAMNGRITDIINPTIGDLLIKTSSLDERCRAPIPDDAADRALRRKDTRKP